MMVRYVFDSNIFMDLQRRQPLDLYPSVWEKVGALMKDGTIISSHEVFEEILAGNDELVLWAKQREDYFLPSTETVQRIVREILKEHRGLVEGGKKKNNADPFVIAIAKEYNCIVVTSETPNGSREAPKIPERPSQNLCKPPMWCRIGAPHWRFSYEQQKESQSGRAGPEGKDPGTSAGKQHQ